MPNKLSFILVIFFLNSSFPLLFSQTDPEIKWQFDTHSAAYGNAAAGDIDGDGKLEIVFGCYRNDGNIYALNAEDGSLLWKYDATAPGSDQGCNDVAILIFDTDKDGQPEVIVPSSCNARTFCFNGSDGSLKWVTNTRGSDSPPVIVDFGNGLEVLHGEFTGWVRSINALTGSTNWDFQVQNNSWVQTAPTILDVQNDGELDFVVGTWAFNSADNHISAYRGKDRSLLWKKQIDDVIYHGSAIGDLDEDGFDEVILGSWNDTLYCLDSRNGMTKWTYFLGQYYTPYGPAVIADMDDDGICEVVVSNWYTISVLNSDGSLKWKYNDPDYGYSFRGTAVADINNDAYPDIIYGNSEGILAAIDGFTRQKIFDLNLREWYGDNRFEIDHAPLIADFDGDGKKDIFIAGGYGVIPMENNFGAGFMISIGPGNGPDWLMFQNDVWRRSNVCHPGTLVAETDLNHNLSVLPNPASQTVLITPSSFLEVSKTTLEIFDFTGRKLDHESGEFDFRENQILWKIAQGIPNGLYILKLSGEGFSSSQKLAIFR
ncbi:MAG TPA: FG-GAP-like repeat-containing protein [Saprospiraceae bacterium]|nr:FG-GAP-like repeat-containing protein [Saprospiraceae bacterium]